MNDVPETEATLTFIYRNWRGNIAARRVVEPHMKYSNSPYHDGPQWFLRGFCLDKQAMRDFALADILTPLRQLRTIVNPCDYKGERDE